MRVKNAEGYTVMIDVPEGCVPVIAIAGATIRGTTYYQDALLTVSDNFAEHLIEQGKARLAEEVK
jgi:hypothetical protein